MGTCFSDDPNPIRLLCLPEDQVLYRSAMIEIGIPIRHLTPLECERLMSWPDHWTQWGRDQNGREIEMSDTQRYRMCGNGVVSDVVAEIARHHIP
jgi:site-specific DNA-cytosine methylase